MPDHQLLDRRRNSGLAFIQYDPNSDIPLQVNNTVKGTFEQPRSRKSSSTNLEMDDYLHSNDLDGSQRNGADEGDLEEDDEETGLTHAERKIRRARKEHASQMDERVAHAHRNTSPGSSGQELVAPTLLSNILVNALLVALWYTFSISISVYNKWMFSAGKGIDFHFPLFVSSIHMVVQFFLASLVLYLLPRFRPSASPSAHPSLHGRPRDSGATRRISSPPRKDEPLMTRWFYLSRISPCGAATALDIGLGNFSLRFISLTFYTMCKSSVLAFVLLFAFVFRLEQPTYKLCTIILFMTLGVVMMVAGETAFSALGFILVMTASFCSGFRWSLTQILLLRHPATDNPFSSVFFLTPIMCVVLFGLALPIEGPANFSAGFQHLCQQKGGFLATLLILFPGSLAFAMVSAEFALLQRSSVVTLSVCGIFKEVLTISAAGAVFGDELSPINVSGLVITIASIAAYNVLKYTKMKRETEEEVRDILHDSMQCGLGAIPPDPGGSPRASTEALMRDDLRLATSLDTARVENSDLNPLRSPKKRLGAREE